jgi:hypothetical protein
VGIAVVVGAVTLLVACGSPSASASIGPVPSGSPSDWIAPAPPTAIAISSPTPETLPSAEPTEFAPPSPACPAPPLAVDVPEVTASIGDGPTIVAARGSSSMFTCSTVASDDAVPTDPSVGLAAHPGDLMTLALPSGWRFLRWEGSDHPAVGEGANVWLPIDTRDRPERIDVPVPGRPGDSIVAYSLWLIGPEDRVVGNIEILVRVRVA